MAASSNVLAVVGFCLARRHVGQQRAEAFGNRKMRNHRVAEPVTVFESGAILTYLAEKTGRFLPKDLRCRKTVS